MPDLTRLAACSEEIVSPGICEPFASGFASGEEFITKTAENGSQFSLSDDWPPCGAHGSVGNLLRVKEAVVVTAHRLFGAENREGTSFAVARHLTYHCSPVGVERTHDIVA
jgi:hypothetical protein